MSRLTRDAAQGLAELAARLAEGQRLARGRRYQRQSQVLDLQVEPGRVTARVKGSRAEPYDVSIACKVANENDRRATEMDIAAAVPRASDIAFTCICPDWGDPCKHGVAVMLQFAQEADDDISLLLTWRSLDDLVPLAAAGTESLARVRSEPLRRVPRTKAAPGPGSVPTVTATESTERTTELDEFFWGAMPTESGALIGPLEELQLDAYGRVRIPLPNVDAGPVLGDAIEAIAEYWLAR
ncbi:MAG: hypothetical protein ACC660_06300 [Acidimicrobiales bacterium]